MQSTHNCEIVDLVIPGVFLHWAKIAFLRDSYVFVL